MSESQDLLALSGAYPFLTPTANTSMRSFAGISPLRYQHPADAVAMEALKNSAGLEDFIRLFSEHVQEQSSRVKNITTNIRVGKRQFPELHHIFVDCCNRLGADPDTELYLARDFNAWTAGTERPYVAIGTPLLAVLTVPELRFVLGHELGHILMQHMTYHQMAHWGLTLMSNVPILGSIPLVGSLLKAGLSTRLREWYRMAEFSADRAGLAACQDFHAAGVTLMKLTQFPLALMSRVDLASIVEQARDIEKTSENWIANMYRSSSEDPLSHPWPVVRVGEMHRWFAGGEYQTLLGETPEVGTAAGSVWRAAPAAFRCAVCNDQVSAMDRFCTRCGAPVGEKDRIKLETPQAGGKP